MIRFEFATAGRIVFGAGSVSRLGEIARELGAKRALVVTGRDPGRVQVAFDQLTQAGIEHSGFAVSGEPTVDLVRRGAAEARGSDLVVAAGGGSVIDGAKAIAALATNPGDVLDYLEVVGKGGALNVPPLAFIAIPTTAGTGSEVTRNAVLGSPEHRVKASLRSPMMLAKAAIVDPQLTRDLPAHLTASTGLDALTQLIEPYVTLRATAITDSFCLDGIRRARVHLLRAFTNGHDAEARENMALVSLYGGLALANAGLGVVHGFAAPIGGTFEAPHGAVCAAILPYGMEENIRGLRSREPSSPALARYRDVARLLTANPEADAEDGAEWVRVLCAKLRIPGLASYGVRDSDIPDLVSKAARASSMKANPIVLTDGELTRILERSLHHPA